VQNNNNNNNNNKNKTFHKSEYPWDERVQLIKIRNSLFREMRNVTDHLALQCGHRNREGNWLFMDFILEKHACDV